VYAKLAADTTVFDSILLNVRADSLVQFGNSTHWHLTGFDGDPGGNHVSNHWCLQYVKDSLSAALDQFYMYEVDPTGGKQNETVQVNDMSLQWGGRFDILGLWGETVADTSHKTHRVGLSTDLNRLTVEGDTLKIDTSFTALGVVLRDIMFKKSFDSFPEKQIHFEYVTRRQIKKGR